MKVTTLPFRKRTVYDVGEAFDAAQQLVDKTQNEILQKIKEELGEIEFEVRAVNQRGLAVGRGNAVFVGTCGLVRQDIEDRVRTALNFGAAAVISFRGGYVPRELENLPPSKSPGPHLRRMRKQDGSYLRTVLVMGQNLAQQYPNIREIFRKFQSREALTADEQEVLDSFRRENNIVDAQVNLSFGEVPELIRTDSTAVHGHAHRGGKKQQRYRISKIKSVD